MTRHNKQGNDYLAKVESPGINGVDAFRIEVVSSAVTDTTKVGVVVLSCEFHNCQANYTEKYVTKSRDYMDLSHVCWFNHSGR